MAAVWRIELFGALSVQRVEAHQIGGPQVQVLERFRSRRGHMLLGYLAYFPRAHGRDALADLLWPEQDPEVGRRSLRVLLSSLRHALEPPGVGAASVLMADRFSVRLNPRSLVTDVAEFESSLQSASQTTSQSQQLAHLAQAVDLYRGPLFAGCDEAWAVSEARRLEDLYFNALRRLIAGLEHGGQQERALQYALRGVSVDALREEVHRDLMRLYAASGRPALAMRQYHELEHALLQLDTSPSLATREMLRRIESDAAASEPPASEPPSSEPPASAGHSRLTALRLPGSTPQAEAPSGIAPAEVVGTVRLILQRDISKGSGGSYGPPQWTRFFGREAEIGMLQEMLNDGRARLITLTGAGGSGKTRLALEVARLHRERAGKSSSDLWFVALANLSDVLLLPRAIADAMRLPRIPHLPPLGQVLQALQSPQAPVVVLDNFEHLLPEGTATIQEMLARVPHLRLVVTSRRALEIASEQLLPVPPMPIPAPDEAATPERLLRYASVQLFHDRARAARPGFCITKHNALAIARLCSRLDGLPLAIELCAARAGAFSPSKMLARLEHRLDFLIEVPSSSHRHPTLRAALGWSYALLWPELQRFFAQLSVFRGGCVPEAASHIIQEPHASHFLHHLQLSSLAFLREDSEESRFLLLETVREFAREQLAPAEEAALQRRHAAFFMSLAEAAEPHLSGPRQGMWLDRLETDADNLRAALEWSVENEPPMCLRLVNALGRFWLTRGHYAEGRRWIQAALNAALNATLGCADPQVLGVLPQLKALGAEANLAWYAGDFADAISLSERALALAQQADNGRAIASAFHMLGYAAAQHGDLPRGRSLLEQSLALARSVDDEELVSQVLMSGASEASAAGDFERAFALGEEGILLARRLGDTRQTAFLLNSVGFAACLAGDLVRARPLLEESLALSQAVGEKWHTNRAWWTLGHLSMAEGDFDLARSLFDRALEELREWGCLWPLPYHLEPRAYMDIAQDRCQRAACLLGAAHALREEMRHALHPALRPQHERSVALLHAALDGEALATEWNRGRALTWEQATALALEDVPPVAEA